MREPRGNPGLFSLVPGEPRESPGREPRGEPRTGEPRGEPEPGREPRRARRERAPEPGERARTRGEPGAPEREPGPEPRTRRARSPERIAPEPRSPVARPESPGPYAIDYPEPGRGREPLESPSGYGEYPAPGIGADPVPISGGEISPTFCDTTATNRLSRFESVRKISHPLPPSSHLEKRVYSAQSTNPLFFLEFSRSWKTRPIDRFEGKNSSRNRCGYSPVVLGARRGGRKKSRRPLRGGWMISSDQMMGRACERERNKGGGRAGGGWRRGRRLW